ncbi:MAG: response regulator [Ignavibacteria bacterium]|nr:response regulator [Ignavibacteria bacterium]
MEKILVVDDEEKKLMMLTRVLRNAGYEVIIGRSGEECIELAQKEKPDIILLDVVMPGIDGIETLKQLRSDKLIRDVYVVLSSGRRFSSEEQAVGLSAGAYDYIVQPIDSMDLLARIRVFLEHKKTLDALRETKELFQNVLNFAPNAGLLYEFPDGNIVYVNDEFQKISNYYRGELEGFPFNPALFFPNTGEFLSVTREVEKEGVARELEIIFMNRGGLQKDFLIVAKRLLLNGKPHVLCVLTDNSERKRARLELEEREELFKSLVENSMDLTILHDMAGTIQFVSRQCEEVIGYPPEYISKLPYADIVHPDDKTQFMDTMENVFGQGNSLHDYEYRIIDASGKIRWMAHSSRVVTVNGKIRGVLNTIRDASLRKEAMEKAQELVRLKDSFFANMSHELRTPLVGILGFSELLQQKTTDAELQSYSRVIHSSGTRLMETLNLILNQSRIDAGRLQPNFSMVNVVDLISHTCLSFEGAARKKKILLRWETALESVYCRTDVQMLRQVVNNLINNAIKFTDIGEVVVKLTVKMEAEKPKLCISVKDTGIGIAPEDLSLIWEEFRQVSEGFGRNFEGSGLGLSITQKFVRKLGGEIAVQSELGIGTVFTVCIPVEMSAESYELRSESERVYDSSRDNKKNARPLKILYIEDDQNAFNFAEILLKNICELDWAGSADEGLAKLSGNEYDSIFMDINLGSSSLDGVETTKKIRQMNKYHSIPIVAITAFAQESDKQEFLAAGCSHYISKPFAGSELKSLVYAIAEQLHLT